ncbi:MAG: ParB/RepB/Spo0J family partition protein [Pseudooceanicola sp.]
MAKRKRLTPAVMTGDDAQPPAQRSAPPIASVAGDAAATAALAEIAQSMQEARDAGRMVLEVPLWDIDPAYLVRDRTRVDPEEMATLIASLRQRGQQTPIEVAALPDGRYGLISGWRRLAALQSLFSENGDKRFGKILALQRQPEQASEAYLAMVEENEIRVGLSYYERARIVDKAVENSVYPSEKAALQGLFSAASRPRRSKIKSFLPIVRQLDGVLAFPESIGERLGLSLSKALEDDPRLAGRLSKALMPGVKTSEAEQATIARVLRGGRDAAKASPAVPIADGLEMQPGRGGALTLRGPALTDDLRDRLVAWLESELK